MGPSSGRSSMNSRWCFGLEALLFRRTISDPTTDCYFLGRITNLSYVKLRPTCV